jgi:hypothetical protein
MKFQLRPMSETEFFVEETDAELSFFKNSKGEVTHAVSRHGQLETTGKRLGSEDKPVSPK